MASRYFTAEEANEALADVRPLAEALVTRRRALRRSDERRRELLAHVAGNGDALESRDLAEVEEKVNKEAAAIARLLAAIQELGVLVKDLDRGLVDFPALRGEEEVLLCWHVGEDEVRYWHGIQEGFAGRRPLPL